MESGSYPIWIAGLPNLDYGPTQIGLRAYPNWTADTPGRARGISAHSEVAGSMTEVTAEILLAGNPPSSACRRTSDSSVA